MLGHLVSLLGLCSAYVEQKNTIWASDLRTNMSGLKKAILFGPCPSHIWPILCHVGGVGPCWVYLAANGTSTAWATRHRFSLQKIKFDMTHFVG